MSSCRQSIGGNQLRYGARQTRAAGIKLVVYPGLHHGEWPCVASGARCHLHHREPGTHPGAEMPRSQMVSRASSLRSSSETTLDTICERGLMGR